MRPVICAVGVCAKTAAQNMSIRAERCRIRMAAYLLGIVFGIRTSVAVYTNQSFFGSAKVKGVSGRSEARTEGGRRAKLPPRSQARLRDCPRITWLNLH